MLFISANGLCQILCLILLPPSERPIFTNRRL